MWKLGYEQTTKVPFTLMYTFITDRFADPAATGALGSMTRGPTIMDASSILSLAKYISQATTSVLEVAAAVRLGCLIMSITPQCHRTEMIQRRLIRGWSDEEYMGYELNDNRPMYPDTFITVMPLDTFISFCFGKCRNSIMGHEQNDETIKFISSQIDQEWTAVPVKMSQIHQGLIVPYIGAFMTTTLFSGKVNHVFKGTYISSDGNCATRSAFRIMPSCNSVV